MGLLFTLWIKTATYISDMKINAAQFLPLKSSETDHRDRKTEINVCKVIMEARSTEKVSLGYLN